MRKAFLIIIAALVVCSTAAGCRLNKIDNAAASPEPTVSPEPHGSVYYGYIEGCHIWYSAGTLSVDSMKDIGGYIFLDSSSFNIIVDKEGKLYSLEDAYADGLLSKAAMTSIYYIHKDHILERKPFLEKTYALYDSGNTEPQAADNTDRD